MAWWKSQSSSADMPSRAWKASSICSSFSRMKASSLRSGPHGAKSGGLGLQRAADFQRVHQAAESHCPRQRQRQVQHVARNGRLQIGAAALGAARQGQAPPSASALRAPSSGSPSGAPTRCVRSAGGRRASGLRVRRNPPSAFNTASSREVVWMGESAIELNMHDSKLVGPLCQLTTGKPVCQSGAGRPRLEL